jgi:hypothetical protein
VAVAVIEEGVREGLVSKIGRAELAEVRPARPCLCSSGGVRCALARQEVWRVGGGKGGGGKCSAGPGPLRTVCAPLCCSGREEGRRSGAGRPGRRLRAFACSCVLAHEGGALAGTPSLGVNSAMLYRKFAPVTALSQSRSVTPLPGSVPTA